MAYLQIKHVEYAFLPVKRQAILFLFILLHAPAFFAQGYFFCPPYL